MSQVEGRVREAPVRSDVRATARRRVTIGVAGTSSFLVLAGTTVVTLALPSLERGLGGGPAAGEWVVNGYTLAFAAILLGAGTLSDTFGARRIFLTGLVIVFAAATVSALVDGMGPLIAAQFVQGAGAALLLPSSLTLATATAPDARGRARVIGVWAAVGGVGMAAGPLVGGVLLATVGWRAVFGFSAVVALAAIGVTVPATRPVPVRPRRLDVAGLLAAVVLSAGLVFALIEGPHLGWATPAVLIALAAFVLGAAAFVLAERRAPDPLLPLRLLRYADFTGSALLGMLFNFAFYGLMFALSLLLQQAKGLSPLATGLTFVSLTGLIAVGNLLAPVLVHRHGAAAVLYAGETLFATGIIAAAITAPMATRWPLLLALLPAGFGGGLVMPTLTARMLESAPTHLSGAASAAFNTSRQIGSAIGVAVFGALLSSGAELTGAFRLGLGVAVAAVMASGVLVATTLRGREPRRNEARP